MEYSSARASTTAARNRSAACWALFALSITIAWAQAAPADEVFDRSVTFHIPASPLAGALVEYSTQSGIRVAAADATVANLKSSGLNGTYSVQAALSALLQGTGLEFSRVGTQTVAIRGAPVGPKINSLARAGGNGTAAQPSSEPAKADTHDDTSAAPGIPDVTVVAPRPPTEQELAGDSLSQFIAHHATVHYVNTGVTGNLARWRGGRPETICPETVGLDPRASAFVTARIRALAENVGAPLAQSGIQCKDNLRLIFTSDPQAVMKDVEVWASSYFIRKYPRIKRLIEFEGDHAIQGWYITVQGSRWRPNFDLDLLPLNLQPVWPKILPKSLRDYGDMGGIGAVILVVDVNKVGGYGIGAITDYLAVLALSVAQSPNHCDQLPSILDLMSSSCDSREKPTGITAGDLAFLKALYTNTGLRPSLSRDDIYFNMQRQFRARQ
jgi:hypothetical protein